jgi:hypothetical protein
MDLCRADQGQPSRHKKGGANKLDVGREIFEVHSKKAKKQKSKIGKVLRTFASAFAIEPFFKLRDNHSLYNHPDRDGLNLGWA